jgi:hypothetical protein
MDRICPWLLAVILYVAMAPTLSAATPPNDAFTNATELVGDDVTFTGSLLGATIDDSYFERGSTFNAQGDAAIWWTWVASGTQPVTLFAISRPVRIAWGDGLVVYDQEPVDPIPSHRCSASSHCRPPGFRLASPLPRRLDAATGSNGSDIRGNPSRFAL